MPRSRFVTALIAALLAGMVGVPDARAAAPTTPAPPYNGSALTPPMGWNDWSYFRCAIDEQLILAQARALVSVGMAAAGFRTVVVDDCWMAGARTAAGALRADPVRFPHGMAWLGGQLHALGLKFGIYEDEGTTTCQGYPGSWGHEVQDADTFATWRADYVKLDGCNMPAVAGQTRAQTYNAGFGRFSRALVATGRPIVFADSAPAYFRTTPDWYAEIAAASRISNTWREGNDIALGQRDGKWASIVHNYGYNVPLARFAGPGHWNDPDFLLVGDGGLTDVEMQSQFILWAEMAAPLISSTDLTRLTPAALKILTNKAVIAVDQDSRGQQAHVVGRTATHDVLAKPLAGGDAAVALFNPSSIPQTVTTTAAEVGMPVAANYRVTDLVSGAASTTTGVLTATVAPHATVLYRVHAA